MSQESTVPPYDRSYMLSIFVDELDSSYSIRVKDSTTITTLTTELVNRIHLKFNWMEFGLWCKSSKIWLLPKSSNMSQFSLHSDSKIHFTRRYKLINIQLPDLQIREMLIDLSKTVFQTTHIICRKIGIRHHEELSFQYKIKKYTNSRTTSLINIKRKTHFESNRDIGHSHLSLRRNRNNFSTLNKKRDVTSFFRSISNSQNNTLTTFRKKISTGVSSTTSFNSTYESTIDKAFNDYIYHEGFESSKLSNSPKISYEEAVENGDILLYKTYKERTTLKLQWLISEFTLMEQGIENFDDIVLLLRFKYHNYFYLDEVYDTIRINQIFNQARWSVLGNETECSEDEAVVLGGILLQVKKSVENKVNVERNSLNGDIKPDPEEEVRKILDKLYLELLGRVDDEIEEKDVEVTGIVQLVKYPKRLFNSYEKYYAEIKDNGIHLFHRKGLRIKSKLLEIIPIKGNQVEVRIQFSKTEYFILEIINLQNESEIRTSDTKVIVKYKFRFSDRNECIRWATGCRLLAKSIDYKKVVNFQYEYNVVTNIIEMKRPQQLNSIGNDKEEDGKIELSEYLSFKINTSFKKKLYLRKLIQFQKSCSHYTQIQSKIAYIKCWLTLRNAGIYYFEALINKKTEKELFGIGYNTFINANIEDGKLKRIWELERIVTWNTNWELIYIVLKFPNESIHLEFLNISECQMFHEYLGGYLFIMMRNSEKYSDLSEKMFRKLTARNLSTNH